MANGRADPAAAGAAASGGSNETATGVTYLQVCWICGWPPLYLRSMICMLCVLPIAAIVGA